MIWASHIMDASSRRMMASSRIPYVPQRFRRWISFQNTFFINRQLKITKQTHYISSETSCSIIFHNIQLTQPSTNQNISNPHHPPKNIRVIWSTQESMVLPSSMLSAAPRFLRCSSSSVVGKNCSKHSLPKWCWFNGVESHGTIRKNGAESHGRGCATWRWIPWDPIHKQNHQLKPNPKISWFPFQMAYMAYKWLINDLSDSDISSHLTNLNQAPSFLLSPPWLPQATKHRSRLHPERQPSSFKAVCPKKAPKWGKFDNVGHMSIFKIVTLQEINISHLGKRKIIFKSALGWDMLVPRRVYISLRYDIIYIYTYI